MTLTLSPDQQAVIEKAKEWYRDNPRENIFVVTGAAGTGKSSIVSQLLKALNIPLRTLIMVANSATATENIQHKNPNVRASTIAKFLKSQSEVIVITDVTTNDVLDKWETADDILACEKFGDNDIDVEALAKLANEKSDKGSGMLDTVPIVTLNSALAPHGIIATRTKEFNITGAKIEAGTQVIVIDELGMVSDEELNAMKQTHMPIIAMGDPYQLPPIGNDLNSVIKNRDYKYFNELTEVHRQNAESALLEVATVAREGGDWYRTAQNAQANGSTDVFVNPNVKRDPQQLAYADVILASTNNSVTTVNRLLHNQKSLHGEVIVEGEKIVVSANSKDKTLNGVPTFVNGQVGVITKIYDDTDGKLALHDLTLVDVTIDTEERKRVLVNTFNFESPKINSFSMKDTSNTGMENYRERRSKAFIEDLSEIYDPYCDEVIYMTYGYAMTVHRAQGKEWDFVMFDSYLPSKMSDIRQQITYTAITRAKKGLVIF